MLNKNFIGVTGLAGSGKDLFIKLLSDRLPNTKRFALADQLKSILDPEIQANYGFSIFNCTPAQKEIARPFLVGWAREKRIEMKGRYFIELLDPKIKEYKSFYPNSIICISDVRYDDYEKDEAYWVKEENKGILVHIQKYKYVDKKQTFFSPPNEEEARNDPKMLKKANYRIIWPDMSYNSIEDLDKSKILYEYIDEFLKWYNR